MEKSLVYSGITGENYEKIKECIAHSKEYGNNLISFFDSKTKIVKIYISPKTKYRETGSLLKDGV